MQLPEDQSNSAEKLRLKKRIETMPRVELQIRVIFLEGYINGLASSPGLVYLIGCRSTIQGGGLGRALVLLQARQGWQTESTDMCRGLVQRLGAQVSSGTSLAIRR